MRQLFLHAVGRSAAGRRLRSWLLRSWIRDLPRLLAPLAQGKGVWGALALGFVLLLSGLGLPGISDLPVEISLPLLRVSFSLRDFAPYGVGGGVALIGLAVCGWVAGRWAAPRAQFWKEMEARGIWVVWDGETHDFRERLDEAMGFALGRGPSRQILPHYVPRPEEEEVLRILRDEIWARPRAAYGVVITGPPVAGKTRTAMELVIRLDAPFVLVWLRGRKEGLPSFPGGVELPVRRAVVLADDLPLSPGEEGPSMPEELTALLLACRGLALIATARADRIPPDVRGVRVIMLQGMRWDERLETLARVVAQVERQSLDKTRGRFTGHPGSLVAGLDRFRQRYEQLPEETGRVLGVQDPARRDRLGGMGRRFLQSAWALWDLGVRTLTLERIWAVVEKAGGETMVVPERDAVVGCLEQLGFLRVMKSGVARFYEGLLTEVIPASEMWEKMARETLQEREDSVAFEEIGNTWSEEYSPAYQRNPREALRRAIGAHEEALRFCTPEAAPLAYAETQNNLGNAYWRLSEHEDPVRNLRRAIAAYGEALRFRTPEVAPLAYAETQHGLGLAYR